MALTFTQNHEQKTLTTSQAMTFQVPSGGKIQSLPIVFLTSAGVPVTEAQIRSEIANIRLAINGRDVINGSPIILLDVYEMLGVSRVGTNAGIAGVVELNVGRLFMIDPLARDLFGFGTNDVTTIQVTITAGTLSAIASAQVISERQAVSQNLGAYMKLITYPQTYNAAATHTVDTLPRDIDSSYIAVFFDDGASGTITSSECKVNSQTMRENLNSSVNAQLMSNKGNVQLSGYFVHAFEDGLLSGQLPMKGVADLRFATTFSVAPGAGGYNAIALTAVNMPNLTV